MNPRRSVEGIALVIGNYEIRIRMEMKYGQVSIEVLNGFECQDAKEVFEKVLEPYSPLKGMMSTVIIGKKNFGYIVKNKDELFTKPLYFNQ